MPFLTTTFIAGLALYLAVDGGWFGRGLVTGCIIGFSIGLAVAA